MKKMIQSMVVFSLMVVVTLGMPLSGIGMPLSGRTFSGGDLNLTDDQKVQLKAVRDEARDEITPLIEQLKALMATMEEIVLTEEVIDTGEGSQASLLIGEITGVRMQIMNIMAEAKLESANVLTLEQREIIIEKKKTRHERREKRRNPFEGRMEGPDSLFSLVP